MPCALVGALQFWLPAVKLTVWPEIGVAGFCETSTSDAMRLTIWPSIAPFGLWFRVIKVESEPGPQVTDAWLEAIGVPLTVVTALMVSTPEWPAV